MNCTLEGLSVKAFGRAIHALARIGDDLWLDPTDKGLALRSVNSAHSAYACFLFSPLFFQHFSLNAPSQQCSGSIKCKLLMKSVLPLFRCLTSIDRSVERCQISISDSSDRVIFQFLCRHGITKTHSVRFQECEALQAVFSSQQCPNVLKSPARLLGDMVMHFPLSQEEITLSTTPLRVSLRNYNEGGNDRLKMVYTNMALHPDEFDFFQVRDDSDITFCLKELRGLLSFAESHCLPVTLHFGAAGKPVCFSVEDVVLEATVILATLINSDNRNSQPTETPAPTTPRCDGVDDTVTIPSSQGSPMNQGCEAMQLLPHIYNANDPCVSDEADASAATTPASSVICSLLFRASEQNDDCFPTKLPVLASYSDDDEDMEENGVEFPSL
ncbi:cell cycle checkpoint control protein RAD9B isoform X2 [Gouania willdenowi]|uniref:Cell cycle checkpoint control protein RAD9A n=1 Tax=Gouania willdenowi TaxID=441366 RepID=A0A8C5GD41_GOUWI|nr:cell cycle checkpoint control protein RAD9B isoform X2 [Gouania willdenowi]